MHEQKTEEHNLIFLKKLLPFPNQKSSFLTDNLNLGSLVGSVPGATIRAILLPIILTVLPTTRMCTPARQKWALLQKFSAMYMTFNELRDLKHSLPTGSIARIAHELNVEEQTVRNYFGARKYEDGDVADIQLQPGPNGGIVQIDDTRIIDLAKKILSESNTANTTKSQPISSN